jgi:enolase
MEFLLWAIEKSGYKPGVNVFLALDVAATELYKNGQYKWENKSISAEELISIYSSWSKNFPLVSIEDACAEEDWAGWKKATEALGSKVKLVGDDLFVTNPKRLKQGIETQTANALLVKPNQIGTLSETQDAVSMAQAAKYITIMSHRSGETEDAIIADLAVGLACEEIKTGSLCRGERTSKYNQLLRIEEELGSEATYRALPT